ncbi:MAG: spore germination protein [Christensenellales bacterium]
MNIDWEKWSNSIQTAFGDNSDMVKLDFAVADKKASVMFLDGFVDKETFENNILKPVKQLNNLTYPYLEKVKQATLHTTPIELLTDADACISKLASGEILLIIDGAEGVLMYSEKDYKSRAIAEPPVSSVLRGPREGFVEDIKTNITMLRRRLATPDLKLVNVQAGKYSATKICVAYIEGIARQSLVDGVLEKINSIDIDGIVESSYVARFLESSPTSLFNQVGDTEKPDILMAKMLEGRIAVFVDGSPAVLTLPYVLYESFQSSEDYYVKSYRASLIRWARLFAMLCAVLLPALHVALAQFQYQTIPFKLLIPLALSSYGLPLTPALEMLFVLLVFEMLSETSIRMPKHMGMALSVVGAIVLGQTAISAGLLSTQTVFVIAISTIGIYCVPDESNSASVLRILFVALAGVLGLLGIVLSSIILLVYLSSMDSFGTSYLAPFAPLISADLQDGIVKAEVVQMYQRPFTIPTDNRIRMKIKKCKKVDTDSQKPQKGEDGDA